MKTEATSDFFAKLLKSKVATPSEMDTILEPPVVATIFCNAEFALSTVPF